MNAPEILLIISIFFLFLVTAWYFGTGSGYEKGWEEGRVELQNEQLRKKLEAKKEAAHVHEIVRDYLDTLNLGKKK